MSVRNPIILDCDPGEDDALAILYALQKQLPLKALVCGFGNTSPSNTIRNGAGLLVLAERIDVPLFRGAVKPFKPHPYETKTVDAGDFVGTNGMCGVESPDGSAVAIHNDLGDERQRLYALAEFVRTNAPITYIVTGPCSTLAHILAILGDDAQEIISDIIVMGGALDTAGNHGPINPETGKSYAEFNFYCDPYGTEAVLHGGIPITIVPWDLTENIVLRYRELMEMHGDGAIASFVLKLMQQFLESYGIANDRAFEFNDCITLIAYEGRGHRISENLRIITEGEQAGRLIRDNLQGAMVKFYTLSRNEIISVRDEILHSLGISK